MIKLELKIIVSRPIEEVFKFLATDFATTFPLIDPQIVRLEQVEGNGVITGALFRLDGMAKLSATSISIPVAEKGKSVEIKHNPEVGTSYSEALVKIVEYIPNLKFTYVQSNNSPRIDLKTSIFFEKIMDETQTSWFFEVKLPWWLRLFEAFLKKMALKELVDYKEHIKHLLESPEK